MKGQGRNEVRNEGTVSDIVQGNEVGLHDQLPLEVEVMPHYKAGHEVCNNIYPVH